MTKRKNKGPHIEFTIIAGKLKNRRIKSPDLGVTRPPLSRLRKSIFDFLAPYIDGARYLDLFSGVGSYMFEAASRGALEVVGIERESRLVESINQQADKFDLSSGLDCLEGDVFDWIVTLSVKKRLFDLVMIAPPQYLGLIDKTLKLLDSHPLLSESCLVLCQHDTSEKINYKPENLSLWQKRKYGNTTFTVFKRS